ncbi:MAG: DNA repair protein RecO [Ignavibacteriales bacterium]|nr:DNA repair protein RecO [Ignavibacteriales bacterium]
MTKIVKTRAIVLRKINYSDTSKIATFYTEELGRISGIIKGGRNPKSKTGAIIDQMNLIELVFYGKENRDVQLVSQADLIQHYPHIKDDFEKIKYAVAILELLYTLTIENEINKKLFLGAIKIFSLLEKDSEEPKVLFTRFLIFFIKELGYELQLTKCKHCGKQLENQSSVLFNFEFGFFCDECKIHFQAEVAFDKELYKNMLCLMNKKYGNITISNKQLDKIIKFLLKYLAFHIQEFKGIKSLSY